MTVDNKDALTEVNDGSTYDVADGQKAVGPGHYTLISKVTPDGRLMIGPDIELFPSGECHDFSSPGARAFDAEDRRASSKRFALICGAHVIPRVTFIGTYKNFVNRHILRLTNAGIVYWPLEDAQRFALVFEKPLGNKIIATPESPPVRIAEDKLTELFIRPVLSVLSDFRDVDAVHGSINLENMYLSGTAGAETLIVGECLSNTPFCNQHPVYEPMLRAMADKTGRGIGTIKDDLYALGMCVAMMARGENLMAGRDPRQILQEKIRQGSYAFATGKERIPSGISEFLRGVLSDDEDQRWSMDEALAWLEGRRVSPRQTKPPSKSVRPLTFMEEKYWDLRSVAESFSHNIPEAAAEIEKGEFKVWLKRNFDDSGLKTRMAALAERETSPSHEKMVFNTCMMIDPLAPPRFRGIAAFPAGLGPSLANAMMQGANIQPYAEIFMQKIFFDWLTQNFESVSDASGMMAVLDRCRNALMNRSPGYGFERVVYTLNAELVCLSPIVRDSFVMTPGNLLLALERVAKSSNRPAAILDRHMIAFISAREARLIDNNLGYINSPDKGKQIIGVLRTLVAVQKRFAVGPVPALSDWILSMIEPAIELISDRDLRQDVTKRLGRINEKGNLTAILRLVDDAQQIQDDRQRFTAAQEEFQALVSEQARITSALVRHKGFGRATGRQVSMYISCILATAIIMVSLAMRLMQGV